MAIPKDITWVTFDVYGTLIDSDTGVYEAFKREAERDGFTVERDELYHPRQFRDLDDLVDLVELAEAPPASPAEALA